MTVFCVHSVTDQPQTQTGTSGVVVRAGGMDRSSLTKSHHARSLSSSQPGGPPCWAIPLAFDLIGWNWGKRGLSECIWNGVLPWLVRWARSAGSIDFCPALAALVIPIQNIICITAHFLTLLVPITQPPGQAVVLGRLSLCLWLWRSEIQRRLDDSK